MSVLRRPPRELLSLMVAVLCMVSTFTLYAQSEVVPVSTSESAVTNSEAVVPVVVSTVEKVIENRSVEVTDIKDAIPASVEVSEPSVPAENPDTSGKAISVEVSPADEVVVDTNSSPAIVMPEVIPAANADSESVTEDNKAKTVSEAIKEEAPVNMVSDSAKNEAVTSAEATQAAQAENKTPVVEEPVAKQETTAVAVDTANNTEAKVAEKEAAPADAQEVSEKGLAEGAEATAEDKPKEMYYFETSRGSTLAVILVLLTFVSYYTFQAQRGREMFIRRISGLSAIEDAVGRATEMGRGVLYVPGIMDMDDIQTIAGVTILGHVARKTAEYDTDLYSPMTRSFVMSVAQEVVKQAYMEKGRVDAYRPDRINYLTDDQFGYVAGVGGIMMRDKPAACFYLGTFYAESLILAETGNSIGAIQIAGTAEPSQIPFFVAACDYTLIGEELFAASAYLSKNPREVGSLKGQDMVKVVIIVAIIIGTLLETLAATDYGQKIGFGTAATTFMEYLK